MDPRATDVTLRHLPLDETLVHAIRGACARAAAGTADTAGPWTVVVERRPGQIGRSVVRATVDVGLPALHAEAEDPDAFLAVRNAFALLLSQLARHIHRAPAHG